MSLGWDADFVGKWVGLIKELLPKASRVALLWSSPVTTIPILDHMRRAGRVLKVTVESFDVQEPNDLEGAFRDIQEKRFEGVFVFTNPFTVAHLARIVKLAASHGVPAVYGFVDFATAGGLIAYSASSDEQTRRAVTFVDRILKGVKPADLPVERPTKFELVINMKTAKALRLTIPSSLLLRADQVIQ
jgi:putative tryptophan/tyrosine transport system substrate-binding protein